MATASFELAALTLRKAEAVTEFLLPFFLTNIGMQLKLDALLSRESIILAFVVTLLAVVKKNSCVILLPDSTLGRMAFVQVDGKWGFVWGKKATFPAAAAKSISGARDAEPDALGKLKLHS